MRLLAPQAQADVQRTLNPRALGSRPRRRTQAGVVQRQRPRAQTSRVCAFESRRPYRFRVGRRRPQQGPDPCPRWFESSSGSHASVAHLARAPTSYVGGSPFDPGQRLCVLVLQLAERPGREPGCSGFESLRAHHAALAHLGRAPSLYLGGDPFDPGRRLSMAAGVTAARGVLAPVVHVRIVGRQLTPP